MQIEKQRELVLLQYGAVGELIVTSVPIHENQVGRWVAIDHPSGGYPYDTVIERAHDFGSVEKAKLYAKDSPGFKIRRVIVTYTVVA